MTNIDFLNYINGKVVKHKDTNIYYVYIGAIYGYDDEPVAVFDAPTNGNFILVKLLHPENAKPPMPVTLLGISILVKLLQ